MKKVVFIVSNIDKSYAFEWTALHLQSEFKITFILLNNSDSYLEFFLQQNKITVYRIQYKGLKYSLFTFWKVLKLLLRIKPQTVHTHLFDADFIGISAAWFARVPQRIYTRHNSSLYKRSFPVLNRIMQVVNRMSTHIVSISKVTSDYLIHEDNVPERKIVEINHGFDLDYVIAKSSSDSELIRSKYTIPEDKYVLGCISRFVDWKGVEYITEAFASLISEDPKKYFLVLANATGPHTDTILEKLKGIDKSSYRIIKFEDNVFPLYKCFDVFVHTPINNQVEAFGQTYIEAMINKVPLIATKSGIANEILEDGRNALIVPYQSSEAIVKEVKYLISNPGLQEQLTKSAFETVRSRFGLDSMISGFRKLYSGS